jgi:uncharacterized protein YcfJ
MERLMKHIARISGLTFLAALVATSASADEFGRVLSSTPNIQAVSVPQQVCAPQQVVTQAGPTGAGAVLGALAGGALGNAVGRGGGRSVATGVGIIGGAVLGNQIEGGGQAQTQTVQQCSTQNIIENRVTGYTVNWEYAGKQYSTQMSNDPGRYVRLQIIPVGGTSATQSASPPALYAPPVTTYPLR